MDSRTAGLKLELSHIQKFGLAYVQLFRRQKNLGLQTQNIVHFSFSRLLWYQYVLQQPMQSGLTVLLAGGKTFQTTAAEGL